MGDGVELADVWVLLENPLKSPLCFPLPSASGLPGCLGICRVVRPTICSGLVATWTS